MSRRSWNPKAEFTSPCLVFAAFGFVSTLIGTNPNPALFFGAGGLTGLDAAGSVSNTGPTFIKSIVKTANNGEFLVTLQDGYRAVWYADPTLWGPVAGPNDGNIAHMSLPANQGQGHETPLTFLITIINGAGNPAELAGRTVSCMLVLKDSGVGA